MSSTQFVEQINPPNAEAVIAEVKTAEVAAVAAHQRKQQQGGCALLEKGKNNHEKQQTIPAEIIKPFGDYKTPGPNEKVIDIIDGKPWRKQKEVKLSRLR